ncbi:MAG: hypothetical protein JWP89_1203 [Schlesneria sp.]|nr:hypothetical protein [Schlesneria sp.]
MEIIKRLSEVGASEEALRQLEVAVGSSLPTDYRRFMTETNGGRPQPSGFIFYKPSGRSDSSVRYFLTLNEREERYSIQEFLNQYGERFPQKMLPIASDSFGNLVLLDVGAKSVGAVCFWDHEKESMDEPNWDNISNIAPSFTDFVNILE